jgi:hypothetical protein
MTDPILRPVIALALWTLAMCGWLYWSRIPAILRLGIVYDPSRPAAEFHDRLPAQVRWKADNYNNLMEQPTLFYAVCLVLALLRAGGGLNEFLAWLYVGLRIIHSLVQALLNRVQNRFPLFAAATLVLLALTLSAAWRLA